MRTSGATKTIKLPGGATMEMIWCEPGSFMMGSPITERGRFDDEPLHMVTLTKGFWLGKYEVTQRQWESVMGDNPSKFKAPDRPVDAGSSTPATVGRRTGSSGIPTFATPFTASASPVPKNEVRAGVEKVLPYRSTGLLHPSLTAFYTPV